MKKRFLNAVLFTAALATVAGSFVSCKDYDDDIKSLQNQIDGLSALRNDVSGLTSQLSTLQATAAAAQSAADAAKAAAADAKANVDAAKAAADAAQAKAKELEAAGATKEEVNAAKEVAAAAAQAAADAAKAAQTKADQIAANVKSLTDRIVALEENAKTVNAENIELLQDEAAKLKEAVAALAGKELRSLTLIPPFFADGIESVEYPYVCDNYWYGETLLDDVTKNLTSEKTTYTLPKGQVVSYNMDYQIDAKNQPVKDAKGKEVVVPFCYNPVAYVSYNLNPSSAVVTADQLSFDNKIKTNMTRATEAGTQKPTDAAAKVVSADSKNGVITVGFTANGHNISNQKLYDESGKVKVSNTEKLNIIALQADVKNGKVDTTITSDYAALYPSVITLERIAYIQGKARETELTDCPAKGLNKTHIYLTAQDAIENYPTVNVEYNGTVDLSTLLNVHYDQTNKPLTETETAGKHKILNYGDVAKYNLEWKFYMTQYYVGNQNLYGSKTNESSYGKVSSTGLFTPQYVDENGNQMTSNGTSGVSSVGKMPLVRVELVDKANGSVVLGGFIKLHIVRSIKPVVAPNTNLKVLPYVTCVSQSRYMTWAEMSSKILETAAVTSKEEFEKMYILDAFAQNKWGTNTTNDWFATVYVKVGDNFVPVKDVKDAQGKYVYSYDKGKTGYNYFFGWFEEYGYGETHSDSNNRLKWSNEYYDSETGWYSKDVLNAIYAQPDHKITLYVRYVEKKNDAADKNADIVASIYVPLTLEVVKPDLAVNKPIKEYWYTDNNVNTTEFVGNFERLNVPYPQNEKNARAYVVDLDNAFETVKAYGFNSVKFDLTGASADAFKSIFRDENTDGHYGDWLAAVNKGDFKKGYTEWLSKVKYIYYFDEPNIKLINAKKATKRALTINGTTFLLYSVGDNNEEVWGTIMSADGKNVVLDKKIAEVKQLISNTDPASGQVVYAYNDLSKLFLNAIGHDMKIANSTANYVKMGVIVTDQCDNVVKEWKFNARFIRPVDIAPVDGKQFVDAADNASYVNIADILDWTDWRDQKFLSPKDHVWYFGFYEIMSINVNIKKITTDMNGHNINKDLLADVTTQAKFSQIDMNGNDVADDAADAIITSVAAKYNSAELTKTDAKGNNPAYDEIVKALGKIKYENNGNNVGTFNVRIPVTISYYWGDQTVYVTCKVNNTINN